jgi:hypothetical protein
MTWMFLTFWVGYPGAPFKIKSSFLDGNGWHVVDVDDTLTKYRGNGDDDDVSLSCLFPKIG